MSMVKKVATVIYHVLLSVLTIRQSCEGRDDAPCAVDVIDTPATEPGTIWPLCLSQVLKPSLYDPLLVRGIDVCQHFQHVGRDVFAGRVQQSAEVGKRQPIDDLPRIVLVERSPGSIA